MLEKLTGKRVELKPREPKENEMLCETCGGTGWLYENERKYIQMCPSCYSGVIRLCPICKQQIKGYCMIMRTDY